MLTADGAQPTLVSAELQFATVDADAVWIFGGAKMPAEAVKAVGPSCKAIIRSGSGTDNIDVKEATAR